MGTDINFKNHLGRTYGTRIGLPAFDPAASAFIQATGITGELQKAAINNLVLNLKKYNLWSKMKAVYPFVTDNKNLLSYTNTLTNVYWQKSQVILTSGQSDPNGGTNATQLAGSSATNAYLFGSGTTVIGQTYTASVYIKGDASGSVSFRVDSSSSSPSNPINYTTSWQRFTYTFTALSTNADWVIGGYSTWTGSETIYVYAPQLELGSTATTYQPISTTTQAYIASQFKYNLVNPVDSDAAFRLVFNGGWTHSSTGAQGNGVNSFANPFLSSSANLQLNSAHVSYYSRTNSAANMVMMGTQSLYVLGRWTNFHANNSLESDQGGINTGNTTAGFFMSNRTNGTAMKYQINGTIQTDSTSSAASATLQETGSLYLGCQNTAAFGVRLYNNYQTAFSTIGDGLTDDDATNLYYSTQVFQTTLGRQVGSPAYALPAVNDVNAKLYLSAINSSDPTVNGAVDTFISGLKTDGIYSKMKAVYPFATDNRNLLSYTEDFTNGYWSGQDSSILANATTAPNGTVTADRVTDNTVNSYHGIIMTTSINATSGVTYTSSIYAKYNGRNIQLTYDTAAFGAAQYANFDLQNGVLGSVVGGTATITSAGDGWYRCSFSATATSTGTNNKIYPLLINSLSSTRAQSFIGDAVSGAFIWGIQMETGSTATTYQPMLGSQQSYIANQFKYNMINPQDDDSAFRLVFNGGWTHSPQGALPNGVNAYADTKLIPSSVLSQNSTHIASYIRNTSQGALLGTDSAFRLWIAPNFNGTQKYVEINSGATTVPSLTVSNAVGLWIGNRILSTESKLYNNSSLNYTAISPSAGLNTLPIYISARNSSGAANYSSSQTAFATIGDGLTDTEAANLYTRVQNLETLLNRQV
jgi:hypothetical protein